MSKNLLTVIDSDPIVPDVAPGQQNATKPKFTRFGHIWSREDDDMLRIAVESYGSKPQWDSIAKVCSPLRRRCCF